MAAFTIIKTITSGLFGKSATINYPLQPKPVFEATRGHIEIDIEDCTFCSICQRKCPTGAINVNRSEKTWSIESYDCIQCGCCSEVCSKKCLRMDNKMPCAVTVREAFTVKQHEKPQVNPDA